MNRGSGHLKLKDTSAFWESILSESITKGGRARPFASKAGYCPTANWFMGSNKGEFVVGATMKLYQGIGGFIDLIAIGPNGSPTLYEIKSCTNLPTKIKPEHAAQAATYWLFSGFERVEVIYVSRKVQNFPDPTPLIKTFQFDPTEWQNEILNVFITLETFNNKKPPQRPAHFVKNRQCMFCDFANRCWDMADTEFSPNKEMSAIESKAISHMNKVLKERKNYVTRTLENCRTSVTDANKTLLENFIKESKKK